MTTKVGNGKSKLTDGFDAAKEAAQQALNQLGQQPDFVLLFCTVGYNQEDVLDGILELMPGVKISGCSGDGVISNSFVDESIYALSLVAIQSDEMFVHNFHAKGLKENSEKVGLELAKQINDAQIKDPKLLLIFPDGLTVNTTPLFAALDSQGVTLPRIGGISGDNLKFQQSFQYHNNDFFSDSVSAAVLSGNVNFQVTVNHGSVPTDFKNTVTKAEANIVYELDNQPALGVIEKYFGDKITTENLISAILCLAFGQEIVDMELAEEYMSNYILLTMLNLDVEKGAIVLPGELKVGDQIQFLRRDKEAILTKAKQSAEGLAKDLQTTPKFMLHVDCAGRGQSIYGEKAFEEPMSFQNAIGLDIPWIGFYSFGEIGPVKGKNYFHNYTSVVSAFW